MDATYLKSKHDAGRSYSQYVAAGKPNEIENWAKVYNVATLTEAQTQLVKSFTRVIKVIGLSGRWCGDCVQQCPLIQKIADANPKVIQLHWVERDEHLDLQQKLIINTGQRVPVIVFCAEDYELVGWYGDRTLTRYRAAAQRTLGATCPFPGAPVDKNEMAACTQDWLNEFERVHLLLRISARLRKLHND